MAPSKGDPAQYFKSAIQSGWFVVDVGANAGSLTAIAAERVGPSGRVLAIEPDERCWPKLDALGVRWPTLTVVRSAVGACSDVRRLSRAADTQQSSLWEATVEKPQSQQSILTEPLDMLVLGTPDLIKLDTQGAEAAIVRGAPRLLAECPRWLVEVWPSGLRHAGESADGLVQALVHAGLTPRWLDRPDLPATDSVRTWISSVAKPKSYVNLLFAR